MTTSYRLTFGITTYAWLCDEHLASKVRDGWTYERQAQCTGLACDLCVAAEQLAPGYVTPTVAALPTSAEARLPTRKEFPRPKPPETWAARLARLRASQQPHAVEAA